MLNAKNVPGCILVAQNVAGEADYWLCNKICKKKMYRQLAYISNVSQLIVALKEDCLSAEWLK